MLRTLTIALFSITTMVAACKKDEKAPEATPAATTPPAEPVKPADPAAKPADPVTPDPAKPADPAAKPADPAATGQNTELEVKGIAMMHRMAELFAANAKDCAKLAVEIKKFIAENKPLITQLAALEKTQSDADRKAFEARNVGEQEAVMKKMAAAVQACGDNTAVQDAMKEFPAE